jgi:hypothetical protein
VKEAPLRKDSPEWKEWLHRRDDDWREWWSKRGASELNLILWALWDPIGCGVPRDEYESYLGSVVRAVAEGSTQDLAALLHRFRTGWIGVGANYRNDWFTALKIGEWYDGSTGGDPFARTLRDRLVRADDPAADLLDD